MPLLGCIADDLTGATDIAGMLAQAGIQTEVVVDESAAWRRSNADAIVVALKTRTADVKTAVEKSKHAADALLGAGCRQIYFKYCSTFDSTAQGNIGPVADMLMDRLSATIAVVCPAFPANARTVYKGHLFVGDTLLSESSMRDHPLTPMRDSSLIRLLQPQTSRKVGLATLQQVRSGAGNLKKRLTELGEECGYGVVDALADEDLRIIGEVCLDMPLVTGGSGLASELARNYLTAGLIQPSKAPRARFKAHGHQAVVAGSCSAMTLQQIRQMQGACPVYQIDARELAIGEDVVTKSLSWSGLHLQNGPVLIYSSAEPTRLSGIQAELGAQRVGALIESALAKIIVGLVEQGVGQLIVAGGETSGAAVAALGVSRLRVGAEIDPGVPWMEAKFANTAGRAPLHLALKSGNFGTKDFFLKAWSKLS